MSTGLYILIGIIVGAIVFGGGLGSIFGIVGHKNKTKKIAKLESEKAQLEKDKREISLLITSVTKLTKHCFSETEALKLAKEFDNLEHFNLIAKEHNLIKKQNQTIKEAVDSTL